MHVVQTEEAMGGSDLEHPVGDLPLHSGDVFVIPELRHFLVPVLEQAEPLAVLQLLVRHKVELLLQLLQAEVVGSRDLSAAGDLVGTDHRFSSPEPEVFGAAESSELWPDTHLQQLHDGGVFRIVGVEPRLRRPLADFLHVVESRRPDVGDGVKAAQTTETKSKEPDELDNQQIGRHIDVSQILRVKNDNNSSIFLKIKHFNF